MAYIVNNIIESSLEGNENYKNESGNHECAVFVKKIASAPQTILWKKGKKVMDAKPGEIKKGTAIATFDKNGKYPNQDKHAAIYISHDKTGILVFDQWNKQAMVKKRTIRVKGDSDISVNNANNYFVIE